MEKHTRSSEVVSDYRSVKKELNETRDCTVTATAVSFGVSYKQAHTFLSETFGRQHGKGIPFSVKIDEQPNVKLNGKKFHKVDIKELKYPGSNRFIREQNKNQLNIVKMPLSKIQEKFNEGTYLVLVKGHALAMKDGVIVDENGYHQRRKVMNLYKIE